VDFVQLLLLVNDVLREATILSNTSGVEILTQKRFTTTAVETVVACNTNIGDTTITFREAFDVFAEFYNDTNSFMAWDERELGDELSLMDMAVSSADTTACHLKQDIIIPNLGNGYLLDREIFWGIVPKGSHCSLRHGCKGLLFFNKVGDG
jgi:hypothetical protein